MKILAHLKWFIYVLVTNQRRLEYQYGKLRGMHCSNVKSGMFHTDLTLHPRQKPRREFITYGEFMEIH